MSFISLLLTMFVLFEIISFRRISTLNNLCAVSRGLDLFYQPRYNPLLPIYSDVLLFHAINCGHAEERLKAVGRKRGLKEALFIQGRSYDFILSVQNPRIIVCNEKWSFFNAMNFLSIPTCFSFRRKKSYNRNCNKWQIFCNHLKYSKKM